jgi:hypothetical protein
VAPAVASLPEHARRDFTIGSFNDDGSGGLADYEAVCVTWCRSETR